VGAGDVKKITAYLRGEEHKGGSGQVVTGTGEVIGSYDVVSSWDGVATVYKGVKRVAVRALINNHPTTTGWYHGKGYGNGKRIELTRYTKQ
jgi:hypothetical protein